MYVHAYIWIMVFVDTFTDVSMCTCVYIHMHIHTFTYVSICTCVYIHMHIHILIYVYTYIYIWIRIFICTHISGFLAKGKMLKHLVGCALSQSFFCLQRLWILDEIMLQWSFLAVFLRSWCWICFVSINVKNKIHCYLCVSDLSFSFYQVRFSPPPGLHHATM